MTTIAPPRPPAPEDLEALIEEARRRARRRRLASAASVVLALAVAGGVYAIVASTTGGGKSIASGLPARFSYVPARGPVEHVRVEIRGTFVPWHVVSLRTGRAKAAAETDEVWYDKASGLFRGRVGVDGRVQLDLVGHATCSNRFCIAPGPLGQLQSAPRWPLDQRHARAIGTDTFRGRAVIGSSSSESEGAGASSGRSTRGRTSQSSIERSTASSAAGWWKSRSSPC
jgi:hypothetical protein